MVQSRRVKGPGSARRATGVRADAAAAGSGALAPGQRWSASRKRDVVLWLLRGELDAVSRAAGWSSIAWRRGGAGAGRSRAWAEGCEPVAAALDAAKRHIGGLSMENDAGACPRGGATPPFADAEAR